MRFRHYIGLLLGLVIGILLLASILLHDPAATAQALLSAHPGWLAVALLLLLFGCHFRWRRLRRLTYPHRVPRLFPFFSSMQGGDLLDLFIIVRPGLIYRPYVLSRHLNRPLADCLAVTIVDRVVEVSIIVIMVLFSVAVWPLQGPMLVPAEMFGLSEDLEVSRPWLVRGAWVVVGVVVAAVACFILLFQQADRAARWCAIATRPFSERLANRLASEIVRFARGLHLFRSRGQTATVGLLNVVSWMFYLLSFGAVLTACGIEWPWYAPVVGVTFLMIAMLAPNTPGLIGQYHAALILGLLVCVPEATIEATKAAAIAMHLVHMTTLVALGIIAFGIEFRHLDTVSVGELWRRLQRIRANYFAAPPSGNTVEAADTSSLATEGGAESKNIPGAAPLDMPSKNGSSGVTPEDGRAHEQ